MRNDAGGVEAQTKSRQLLPPWAQPRVALGIERNGRPDVSSIDIPTEIPGFSWIKVSGGGLGTSGRRRSAHRVSDIVHNTSTAIKVGVGP
jgi:hypothetical protein